ncbi:MAG: hypothetical protein LBC88_07325, partial [Spirochaetaceae bacterium]|nr:hypothetical protein [Spirochaetaceae bacterium]
PHSFPPRPSAELPSSAPAQAAPPLEPNQLAASSIDAARSAAPAQSAPPLEPNQPAAAFGVWHFDDMLLDEAHDTQVRREVYPYDFTPYERFY